MFNLKKLINYFVSKSSGNLYCLLRSLFEKILYGQKRNLYFRNNIYLREFKEKKKIIYFPDKERSRLYSRGYEYRLKTLSQMYLLNEIKFKNNDVLVDCGANIGEIKLIFDNLDIKIDYYAFEPGDKEFKCLKRNLNSKNLYNVGLWKSNSVLKFYEKTDTADSSFIKNNNFSKITIKKVKKLDNLIFKKIKLFKVEAEGAEPEVLLGSQKTLNRIEYISVDCGPERGIKNEKTIKDVKKILNENKFNLLKKSKLREVYLFKNIG